MAPSRTLLVAVLLMSLMFPSADAFTGYCDGSVIAQTGMPAADIAAAVAACGVAGSPLAAEVTDVEIQELSDSLVNNGGRGDSTGFDVSVFCGTTGVDCFFSEINGDNRGGRTTADDVVVYKAVFPSIVSLENAAAAVGLDAELNIPDCLNPAACRTPAATLLQQIKDGLNAIDSGAEAAPRANVAPRTAAAASPRGGAQPRTTGGATPRG